MNILLHLLLIPIGIYLMLGFVLGIGLNAILIMQVGTNEKWNNKTLWKKCLYILFVLIYFTFYGVIEVIKTETKPTKKLSII